MTSRPDPSGIMGLATQYWDSQTLLTANRIGLFAFLSGGAAGAAEVAAALGTAERPTGLLLNACVALGLLEKEGVRYRNSDRAAAFLVPGTPAFLGDAIQYSDNLYQTWGLLERALREDAPQLPESSYLGDDPQRTRAFVYGMHERALGAGRALVELVDLSLCRQMLDVGGGPGTYSALFAKRFPQLRSRVLDLPAVVAIATEIVAAMGAAQQVETLAGDYHETVFPGGNDVVLISGVLHRETEANCRNLIERARKALDPGGLLVISDVFTEAGNTAPPFAALFGLNMLLTAPDGGVHADAEVKEWMRECGFTNLESVSFPPPMPHRVVSGRRQ